MVNINVVVVGDSWANASEVVASLKKHNGQKINLDFGSEAPDLIRLGVMSVILKHISDLTTITISGWLNPVQALPVKNTAPAQKYNHFFYADYITSHNTEINANLKYLFGLFVGRRTISRCLILYEVFHLFDSQSFLSLMEYSYSYPWNTSNTVDVERLDDWVDQTQQSNFKNWWIQPPISSVDQCNVADQYTKERDTNQSLLSYYKNFSIEIVCETFCYGNTFFPTEKTIRPISACKPFLVFGPVNFLSRLRDIGFKTFDSFWDETYDSFEGKPRWELIKETLVYIKQKAFTNDAFLDDLSKITKHNQKLLHAIKSNHRAHY